MRISLKMLTINPPVFTFMRTLLLQVLHLPLLRKTYPGGGGIPRSLNPTARMPVASLGPIMRRAVAALRHAAAPWYTVATI